MTKENTKALRRAWGSRDAMTEDQARREATEIAGRLSDLLQNPKLSTVDIARIRGASWGYHLAPITPGIEWKRARAVAIAWVWRRWSADLRKRAHGDGESAGAEFLKAVGDLLVELAFALDEPLFLMLSRDGVDLRELSNPRRQPIGIVAWICARTGALEERAKEHPDREDLRSIVVTLKKAIAKKARRGIAKGPRDP